MVYREIEVGERGNRTYLGNDNIVYDIVVGDIDETTAAARKEAALQLAYMTEGKVNALLDLNRSKNISMGARHIFQELVKHEKIGKIAIIGLNPVARVAASFLMGFSKKNDMRFFRIKREALSWLRH